jgi:hypothetical protein
MNRIRKTNDGYQVLNFPCRNFDPSTELLSGGWTDHGLRGFSVVSFETLHEAQLEALNNGADINWEKLHEDHKIFFDDLKQNVVNVLIKHKFIVDFNAKLLNGQQIKNALFDRAINNTRFTLAEHFNDIVSFNIVNPWSKNCTEIVNLLKSTKNLRIYQEKKHRGVTHLIGITPSNTTYEITIWTTLMYQCSSWLNMHPVHKKNKKIVNDMYKNTFNAQAQLDKVMVIR